MAGFDDIFAAELCTPSLTTLGGAHADLGRATVELLLEAASGPRGGGATAPQLVLPSQLVLRNSTGTAPAPAGTRPVLRAPSQASAAPRRR